MRESSCRFARNRIETGVDHLTQRGKWKEGGEFRLMVIDQSAQRNSQRKRLEKEETNEEIIQQIK